MIRACASAAVAVLMTAVLATGGYGQRSPRSGSLPRITMGTAPPIASSGGSRSGMGVAVVPRGGAGIERRSADLRRPGSPRRLESGYDPRYDPRAGSRFGTPYGSRYGTRISTGIVRRPFVRSIVRSGCGFGCACGIRGCRVSHFIGVPFGFVVPIPFIYESYELSSYSVAAGSAMDVAPGTREPPRSKVIIVGAGGASDALTVESLRDSVRLSWLATGKPVREVRLFLADSAQRQLASRSASPTNPRATFETATLSASVAFVGVTVVFMDGVTSTTVVPYRRDERR